MCLASMLLQTTRLRDKSRACHIGNDHRICSKADGYPFYFDLRHPRVAVGEEVFL